MNCPYCGKEMKLGYIQCRDGVWWSEKTRILAALPAMDVSAINLSSGNGFFSGEAVEAYLCSECKKIVIDYDHSC